MKKCFCFILSLLICADITFSYVPVFATKAGKELTVETIGGNKITGTESDIGKGKTKGEVDKHVSEVDGNSGRAGLSPEREAELMSEFGLDEGRVAVLKSAWLALTNEGYSKEAVAGMFGNAYAESGFDPSRIQSSPRFQKVVDGEISGVGPAIGFFQWDGSRRDALAAHAKTCEHGDGHDGEYVTLKLSNPGKGGKSEYTICTNIECQIVFTMVKERSVIDSGVSRYENFNKVVTAPAYQGALGAGRSRDNTPPVSPAKISGVDQFKRLTDVYVTTIVWWGCWERPASSTLLNGEGAYTTVPPAYNPQHLNYSQLLHDAVIQRYQYAQDILELMTATAISADVDAAGEFAKQLVSLNIWEEPDLVNYARLCELNVDHLLSESVREDLSVDELTGLSNWERNVYRDAEQSGVIRLIRRIIMLFGIFFTVWAVFVYLAYWFDRINAFVDIDVLGLVTLGHLHISDTEEECTFKVRDIGKEGHKTVNHMAVIEVCAIAIAFGVVLITGLYFKIILWMMNIIKHILTFFN